MQQTLAASARSATTIDPSHAAFAFSPCTFTRCASALYVYALLPAADLASLNVSAIEGVEPGEPVRAVVAGSVAAIVGECPIDRFTGPQAEARLADVHWLAPRAARHDAVAAALACDGAVPVLPLRFGTLLADEASLRRRLAAHEPAIAASLDRIRHRSEFSLRLVGRPSDITRALAAAQDQAAVPAPTGAAYLRRKRLERDAGSLLKPWLEERASQVLGLISAHGLDARPARAGATRDAGREVLRAWALLAPDARTITGLIEDVQRALRDQRLAGGASLELEAAGPWPPYSFCPDLGEDIAAPRTEAA